MFDHRRKVADTLLALALLSISAVRPVRVHAQTADTAAEGSIPTVVIEDGTVAAAVVRAAVGAQRRLDKPTCARVLDDFRDGAGRTLRSVLDDIALPVTAAMTRVIFRDGRDLPTCRQSMVIAFTGPGSRVVFVCGNRFGSFSRDATERLIIHELLHTLGLGERPPTPTEIDLAVSRRCS